MGKPSIVYIDGFNFYYGALKNTSNKWLDLETCFKRIRQDDDIQKIYYFTAKVDGAAFSRQKVYLDAIATTPLVEIVLGLYKRKELNCRVSCSHSGSRKYVTFEEKRTDVNIAMRMIDDAYRGNCERMILVSGDSDLVPALEMVRARIPSIETIVYVPANHPSRAGSRELRNAAHRDKTLFSDSPILSRSQFPPSLVGKSGNVIYRPSSW